MIYLAGEFFPRKPLLPLSASKEEHERRRGINLRPVIARTVIEIFNQLIYSLGCSSCSLTVKNLFHGDVSPKRTRTPHG